MKTIRSPHLSVFFCTCVAVLLLMAQRLAKAEITGQWNFTDGLAADIGQDLEWNCEQGEADFGKASKFKVKSINQ